MKPITSRETSYNVNFLCDFPEFLTFRLLQLGYLVVLNYNRDVQIQVQILREKERVKSTIDDSNLCKLGPLKLNGWGNPFEKLCAIPLLSMS